MTITSIFDRANQAAPLCVKYQGQSTAQPAFIELDPERRTVTADYDGEIDKSILSAVWHGRLRRYKVPATLKGEAIPPLLEELMPLFERVASGYTCEWNGSTMVGRLSEDAMSAEEAIEQHCEAIDYDSLAEVYEEPEGWLDECLNGDNLDDIWPSGQTLDEAVDYQTKIAAQEGIVLLFDAQDLRSYFLRRASELADDGRTLSSQQCRALLAEGYELSAFIQYPHQGFEGSA